MKLPFRDSDAAHSDFQYLEDLATAYWYSEVLFAALELKLFARIEQEPAGASALARGCACGEHELQRLLRALERLELIHRENGLWFNSQAVRLYLLESAPAYIGDFLLYRRRIQPRWMDLVKKVASVERPSQAPADEEDYAERNFRYVQAMHEQAKRKAEEIVRLSAGELWEPPILDVGGGAGALGRALISTKEHGHAVLFDLDEVIAAARVLTPDEAEWKRLQVIAGDFRTFEFPPGPRYGMVVLSNFLHAYGAAEARLLLRKAVGLLKPDGLLLIHDYFPDRIGGSPHKGALYDLNMMLNTYNGECHEASVVTDLLRGEGMTRVRIKDLAGDTSIILADRNTTDSEEYSDLENWVYVARELGFHKAVVTPAANIVTAPWVRMKCKCGCELYGRSLQCPPHGLESHETAEILACYSHALLLEGSPPGRVFHDKLREIERRAFLAGFHKALVFGAGPCPVCVDCPENGVCRRPDLARPSMEGSGIDVYASARNAGIDVKPVTSKDRYVKYIGILLLE